MHLPRTLALTLTAGAVVAAGLAIGQSPSSADKLVARATLIDDTGAEVGTARFTMDHGGEVTAAVEVGVPAGSPEFHGMHIHSNANGTGCVPGTGFTGVLGHWDVGGHIHGAHTGDLPPLVRQSDGTAVTTFVVDKFLAADLVGKALVVHAGPDNFANVPLGAASNQYTDNGTAFSGTGGTASTGNAGARYACGVIEAK
jgi:Cu-Zn family superoxide dismutase